MYFLPIHRYSPTNSPYLILYNHKNSYSNMFWHTLPSSGSITSHSIFKKPNTEWSFTFAVVALFLDAVFINSS
jgi:hypothetical protein